MQEAGIPVTYGYISDLHEKKADTRTGCTTATPATTGRPLGPGDSCYVANAQHYDAAFQKFFERLAADGITPANTLFVISSEENDQFAGANVGRATQPTPAGCDGVTVPCNYAAGQIGELQANIKGLLSGTAERARSSTSSRRARRSTSTASPPRTTPSVRQLERDTAAMTAERPVQRRQRREDHEVPGRRARAARAAHADGRSAADADVHAVPETATTSSRPRGRTSASTAASPTTTATTARTSTSPGSASPGRASPSAASTARSRPTATSRTTRSRRRPCRRRARSGRGSRRPTSDRRCSICSG